MKSRFGTLLGLAALALAGCDSGTEPSGNPAGKNDGLRSVSERTYIDSSLGFTLTAPPGWETWLDRNSAFMFPTSPGAKEIDIPAYVAEYPIDSSQTLEAFAAGQATFSETATVRQGVTVFAAYDLWYVDYPNGASKTRKLFFQRGDRWVEISLEGALAEFNGSGSLRFIDSSLTFF
jgi:hypothetical protein